MQEHQRAGIRQGEEDSLGPDLELPESYPELSYIDIRPAHSLSLETIQRDDDGRECPLIESVQVVLDRQVP